MRKEYWQLEAIFNASKDGLENYDFNDIFSGDLSVIDMYDLFDDFMRNRFDVDFVSYDWKEMNEIAEDYVKYSRNGYFAVDAECGENGGDSFEIYWVPKNRGEEFLDFGKALSKEYYDFDVMEIVYDSSHFYPQYLPKDVMNYLDISYIYDED